LLDLVPQDEVEELLLFVGVVREDEVLVGVHALFAADEGLGVGEDGGLAGPLVLANGLRGSILRGLIGADGMASMDCAQKPLRIYYRV
jgi:hypothetical protein